MQTYTSHSDEETRKIASEMARTLPQPACVLLHGPLGSGKTTFVRGLAEGLEVADTIASPSYTYLRTYPLASGGTLYHFDLYLLSEKKGDTSSLFLDEALQDPNAIIAIEWAEYLPRPVAEMPCLDVELRNGNHNQRTLRVKKILHQPEANP